MKLNGKSFDISLPTVESEVNALVQRLHLLVDAKEGRTITFIAARPDEGTSTIAAIFATSLAAETGQKVLLLDAGTQQSDMGRRAAIDPSIGLVDAFARGSDPSEAIHPLGNGVSVARWIGQDHNRSLANKLLQDGAVWRSLRGAFHTVVIDAPALQVSSDGIPLSVHADATVLVVESGTTRQPVIENLRDTLSSAGAKLAGIAMNKRQYYIPEKVYARL
jgi:Mrp family chromosome partitioning ATPase